MLMTRLFLVLASVSFFAMGCANNSAPTPPQKKSLSVQPHNRPASWEGSGGLGAVMGPQYPE